MKKLIAKTVRLNYIPLEGFHDLRDFIMPDEAFAKFYRVQQYLYSCEAARLKGYYQHNKAELNRTKELSAQYQQALFSFTEM